MAAGDVRAGWLLDRVHGSAFEGTTLRTDELLSNFHAADAPAFALAGEKIAGRTDPGAAGFECLPGDEPRCAIVPL